MAQVKNHPLHSGFTETPLGASRGPRDFAMAPFYGVFLKPPGTLIKAFHKDLPSIQMLCEAVSL